MFSCQPKLMDISNIGTLHQANAFIKEIARTIQINNSTLSITMLTAIYWPQLVRINIFVFTMSRLNPLYSRWRKMESFQATQIESSALDSTHFHNICWHLEDGTILYRSTISDKRAQSHLFTDLTSAVTELILRTMETLFSQVVIDKLTC